MKYKAAIFDMDGTILNTLTDLQSAVNYALNKNGLPERTYEEVRFFVGNGILKLIQRAVPQNSSEKIIQQVYDDFTTYYKAHNADTTKPYEGITDAISELKKLGIKTAVVSNKADYGVQALVKDFFDGLFDAAIGQQEGLSTKPSADMVNLALTRLNVQNQDAVYIGDSDVDFETAKNSQMDFIGVDWGFRGREFLIKLGTQNIASTADDLISIITGN